MMYKRAMKNMLYDFEFLTASKKKRLENKLLPVEEKKH